MVHTKPFSVHTSGKVTELDSFDPATTICCSRPLSTNRLLTCVTHICSTVRPSVRLFDRQSDRLSDSPSDFLSDRPTVCPTVDLAANVAKLIYIKCVFALDDVLPPPAAVSNPFTRMMVDPGSRLQLYRSQLYPVNSNREAIRTLAKDTIMAGSRDNKHIRGGFASATLCNLTLEVICSLTVASAGGYNLVYNLFPSNNIHLFSLSLLSLY